VPGGEAAHGFKFLCGGGHGGLDRATSPSQPCSALTALRDSRTGGAGSFGQASAELASGAEQDLVDSQVPGPGQGEGDDLGDLPGLDRGDVVAFLHGLPGGLVGDVGG